MRAAAGPLALHLLELALFLLLTACLGPIARRPEFFVYLETSGLGIIMAAQRESSVEQTESEWAGISESGDDDMDFEVSRV
jgi:hypothetical protein